MRFSDTILSGSFGVFTNFPFSDDGEDVLVLCRYTK
jgi:hypothetical protein